MSATLGGEGRYQVNRRSRTYEVWKSIWFLWLSGKEGCTGFLGLDNGQADARLAPTLDVDGAELVGWRGKATRGAGKPVAGGSVVFGKTTLAFIHLKEGTFPRGAGKMRLYVLQSARMDFFKRDLSLMLQAATDKVAPVFEDLLEHHPEGLQSLLAYWQMMSLPEGSSKLEAFLDQALERLDVVEVAQQALWSDRRAVLEALVERGVSLGSLMRPDADQRLIQEAEEEAYVSRREAFVVAHIASEGSTLPQIGLARLAELDPSRPGCITAPAAGPTTSWLALALLNNQPSQAERIWQRRLEEGGQWSVEERAEAALAWLAASEGWIEHGVRKSLGKWWGRLMTPDVALEPVAVKPSWARQLETNSHLRFRNLKSHVESALVQAERGQPADMMGVLMRTLLMTNPAMPTLRPVDMALFALAQMPSPDEGVGGFLKRVAAFDWASVPPDAQGRPVAMVALEVGFDKSNSSSRPQAINALWGKVLPALDELDQGLWWSVACSMAARGHALPLKDASSHFAGRFDLAHHQSLVMEVADLVEETKGTDPRKDRVNDAVWVLRRFWNEVVPSLAHASTPAAADFWETRRLEMLPKLSAFKADGALAVETLNQWIMDLKLPLPTVSANPRPRM